MNEIAWRIIQGFIQAVAVLGVLGAILNTWKSLKELALFGLLCGSLIFGALLIGKFVFPLGG